MSLSAEHRRNGHQRMRERLLKNFRCYAVVLSIVLAGTYLRVLRPPQPLGGNDGNGKSHCSYFLTIFVYFNAFSFYFAACGVLLAVSFSVLPLVLGSTRDSISIEQEVDAQMKLLSIMIAGLLYMAMFLALSLTSWAIAFLFAGLATMSEEGVSEKLSLIIPCAVGIWVFLQSLFIFVRNIVHFLGEVRAFDEQLWTAIKSDLLCGKVLNWYMERFHGRGSVVKENL